MYKNSVVHYIAKALTDIMFFGGIICVIAIPFVSRWFYGFLYYTEPQMLIMDSVLIFSGLCVVYILFQLKRMFRTLLGGNPFINENISCFRKMAVACALISAIYLAKTFLMFSVGTVVFSLIFAVGCLFCLTLKDIFKQAVAYKEENDLTV